MGSKMGTIFGGKNAAVVVPSSSSPTTFFIGDRRMLAHKCEWDENHIEKPERLEAILDLLENDGILKQCTVLESQMCSEEKLGLVHTQKHIDQVREASSLASLELMEQFAAQNEDIYVNGHSWESALLSVGCALKAMEAVLDANKLNVDRALAPNAFAAIRPPGHHASPEAPCGFCLFNNVAICAKKARAIGIQRVLIIDWDVHAGQGTQYCIEGDEGIKLVSIHRFEEGHFWPELPESGISHKYKNTINVPLDEVGYGDAEYAAIFHFLVLPLIREWKPELLLVSCGFDAALGDPEGEMEVTPACYGYLTGLLAQLGIPLCLLLEGGYFVPIVAQSALLCMRALVKKAPPILNFCTRPPSANFLRTLFSVLQVHSKEFGLFDLAINLHNKFRLNQATMADQRRCRQIEPFQVITEKYSGQRHCPIPNPTRNVYAPREAALEAYFAIRLEHLVEQYKKETFRHALGIQIIDGKLCLTNGQEFVCEFHVKNHQEFLLIYHFLLLPLAFTHFELRFGELEMLRMSWKQIEGFVPQDYTENAANEELTILTDDVQKFVDKLPMMKHFFFF